MRSKSTIVVIVLLKDLRGDLNHLVIFNLDNIMFIVALVDVLVLLRDSNCLDFECFDFIFSYVVPEEADLGVLV